MKSEEAIFQELERERIQQQAAILGGVPGKMPSARFMIASEALVLLGKACEIMIREMTVRGWRHTELSKRRTLQRPDVYAAVGESEMFDFLIDLVPRMTSVPPLPPTDTPAAFASSAIEEAPEVAAPPDNIMTISDAENRYAQLQQLQGQMQERYMTMQQHMQPDGSGAPASGQQAQQPQVMMDPHFQIQQTQQQQQGEAPQWQAAPAPATDNNNNGTNPIPPPGI